jgi:uncharacterized protein (DUF1697 family)
VSAQGQGERKLALLRGINVGGHRAVPMAQLRELAAGLGWSAVSSYIQSGNLLFNAAASTEAAAAQLEAAIAERFGFAVPCIVRSASSWFELQAANPMPEVASERPNLLLLALARESLPADAGEQLQARAAHGERVVQTKGALWIDYGSAVAKSKLTPTLLDRLAGSPVTTRNWRSVVKLAELLRDGAA